MSYIKTENDLNIKRGIQTEEYKRSNHNDFKDSFELKKEQFSGYRTNNITNDCEIWLQGEIKKTITVFELSNNPNAVQQAMQEIFQLDSVLPDTEDARAYGAYRDAMQDKDTW